MSRRAYEIASAIDEYEHGFLFASVVRGRVRLVAGVEPVSHLVDDLGGRNHGVEPVPLDDFIHRGDESVIAGYTSFSSMSYWEKVPRSDPAPFHDFEFGRYQSYIEENGSGRIRVKGSVPKELMKTSPRDEADYQPAELVDEGMTREEYAGSVESAKTHILQGDIFQVVLARRLRLKFRGEYPQVLQRMAEVNPSPYIYYYKFGDRRILGTSPETLYRTTGSSIETYPIAGTKPVLGDPVRDEIARRELLTSKKEASEHVMLVDLSRNDLGKVCEIGSVSVPVYRMVKRFSHVQHLVSKVSGRLLRGVTPSRVYEAVFPAGTVSGAPKIRAVEIINQLEKSPRGPYSGAIGVMRSNGDADFGINIRSIHSQGSTVYVGVGAGIVADSDPVSEYYETVHKSWAALASLGAEGFYASTTSSKGVSSI